MNTEFEIKFSNRSFTFSVERKLVQTRSIEITITNHYLTEKARVVKQFNNRRRKELYYEQSLIP